MERGKQRRRCVCKIPRKFRRRRHKVPRVARLAVAPPIVSPVKEGFVLNDRPAKRSSKLVLPERKRFGGRSGEWIEVIQRVPSVKSIVAHILKRRAVKAVRSRLRHHVDHAARGSSVLGLRILPDNLELLNQIEVRHYHVCGTANIGV